jgi:hypothetical protein
MPHRVRPSALKHAHSERLALDLCDGRAVECALARNVKPADAAE